MKCGAHAEEMNADNQGQPGQGEAALSELIQEIDADNSGDYLLWSQFEEKSKNDDWRKVAMPPLPIGSSRSAFICYLLFAIFSYAP
jgi:hypothetical protein